MTQTAQTASSDSNTSSHPSHAARKAQWRSSPRGDVVEPVELKVTGAIPEWFNGAYYRNGSGFMEPPMKHLFSGYGVVVKLQFADGKATEQHRYVQSMAYKRFRETGKMQFLEFGTPTNPAKDFFNTMIGLVGGPGITDNASVNVQPYWSDKMRLLAMTETLQGHYNIDPDTLATEAQYKYTYSDWFRPDVTTAHPDIRYEDGTAINVITQFLSGYNIVRTKLATGETKRIAHIPCRRGMVAWTHDMPVSAQHAILPEMPMRFNMSAMSFGLQAPHVVFDWKPEFGTTLHAVNLKTGAVREYSAPPLFFFHYANAFEHDHPQHGRSICIDAPLFENGEIVNDLLIDRLMADGNSISRSAFMRLVLPLKEGARDAIIEDLVPPQQHDNYLEFPTMNSHVKYKDYRYVYAAGAKRPTNATNAIYKLDLQSRSVCGVWHEAGGIVGESTFIPHPNAESEDDGIVLNIVAQSNGKHACVLIDGQSFSELARAELVDNIPGGFHGAFVPYEQM